MRIVDYWFWIRRAAVAMMHYAFNRHIEPRCQTRDIVRVRFAGPVFDARQGRGGNSRLVRDVAQTQAPLFTTPTNRSAQLRRIYSGFLCHGLELTTP